MEAEHFFKATHTEETKWTIIPFMGRTLSSVALMPYTKSVDGASLSYRMQIPKDVSEVTVHVVVKSTLAFHDSKGHEYTIGFAGGEEKTINFNADLNEDPQNVYSKLYPTVARRVVKKEAKLGLPLDTDGLHTMIIQPLDPGIVFQKIIVDFGGYNESYLFMNESPNQRIH